MGPLKSSLYLGTFCALNVKGMSFYFIWSFLSTVHFPCKLWPTSVAHVILPFFNVPGKGQRVETLVNVMAAKVQE